MKKRVKILLWILWVIVLLWVWVYCCFKFGYIAVVWNCCDEPLLNPNGTIRSAYDDDVERKCNKEWGEMHYLFQPNNYFEICIFKDDTFCYIEDFDNWECDKLNIEELWEYKDLWTFVMNYINF